MNLKKHGKENHQAEETLTKFANIHIQNNTKYKDVAQRILLQQNVSTLFAANASYHKDCYQSFRSPCLERSSQKSKSEFFKLISYHIIERHEIYTLPQLRKAYDEFTKGTRLRSLDLKEMLIAKFGYNFKFVKSSYNTSSKTSEYVLSSSDELIADCINAAGEGIQLSVTLRNITRSISLDIQQRSKENPKLWPPVTQDIIGKNQEKGNICLYNFIALIVSPNSPFDIDGSVKLSKGKATKVNTTPNTTPVCINIKYNAVIKSSFAIT